MAKTKLNAIDPLKKPATVGDLKALVQALGPLVRESVREEVADQVRPLRRDVEKLQELTARLELVFREVPQMVADALGRERERLANDMRRDLDHRRLLGQLDLARHPMRHGATTEDLAAAREANHAFVAGIEAKREGDRLEAQRNGVLPDNRAEGRPELQPGETPAIVDGEVVGTDANGSPVS